MTPSSKWFPTNLQERAAWYDNFNTNIQIIGASLGLTAPELTLIDKDNGVIEYLAAADVTVNAYVDGVRMYRRVITEGDIGDPVPDFPADISLSLPSVIATGMFERLDQFVKRIRVAAAFTPETGAVLGINPSSTNAPTPADAPPKLTASVDPGNVIEVRFVKSSSDGIYIEINVDNGGWAFRDKAVKSPGVFTVPPSEGGTPRSVMVRARYLDGNTPVGDWSDVVTVQTIP